MAQLYRYEVTSLDHAPYLNQGEPLTVEGTPMVRLPYGTIVTADGFHSSKAAATLAAAHRLQAMLQPVLDRIASMEKEAADAMAAG